jgi:SPOR domain
MSGSGSRAGDEINLEEFERRLRAAGAQQARAEDPLAELSRLVEFSHFGISNGETPTRAGESNRTVAQSAQPIETASLRPTLDEEVEELAPGASKADREARGDYEFAAHGSSDGSAEPEERRPMRWKLGVSGLAVAGVAMIGAVFALKGAVPGLPKPPPFIAAAQGPVKVAPPSNETVASSNDPGASLLNDNAKPGPVKVVNSEEQPIDLTAEASLSNPPSVAANPPSAPANPPAASAPTPLAATANTPLVAPPGPPPPAMSSEFPDPKPVRTVSLRPDGTPIALPNPPAQAPAPAPSAPEAAAPSAPAPNRASEAAGAPEPSTPKLDLPAKPEKSSARVVVAKTDTTAPAPTAETPNETAPSRASAKAERARRPKPGQVADATETTGAIAEPPVDATAATTSGGWSVQLAAPRSEAEANKELARLTDKYSAQLNGSAIGVHKAVVRGETIYRLRVVGLTKADAAKLCARVKGDGGQCFIAR